MNAGLLTRRARRAALGLGALVIVAVATGAGYESIQRRHASQRYPARGRLVDIGGRRLQLDCRGAGSPTVVMEAGLDNLGSLSWASVQDSVARTTRTCAYSRAGILWSDPAPAPFVAERVPRDLHAALVAAGERAPWVIVAHSIGGAYATLFTSAYPAEVVGVVFVDASHPAQFARYAEVSGRSMKPPAGLVGVGAALAWTGIVRVMSGESPRDWPLETVAVSAAYLPTSLDELHAELLAVDSTLASAGRAHALGNRPLVVLTGAAEMDAERLAREGLTRAQGVGMQAAWKALQDEEATWSSRSRHEMVRDASHYVQFDRPDVVIGAVLEVVARARGRATRSLE